MCVNIPGYAFVWMRILVCMRVHVNAFVRSFAYVHAAFILL